MKHSLLVVIGLLLFTSACASTEGNTTRVALQAGSRMLDSDWEPLDSQPMLGVDVAMADESGVGAEYGLSYSHDTADVDVMGTRSSFESDWFMAYVGVRKSFLPANRSSFIPGGQRTIPYVALGLAGMYSRNAAESGGTRVSADDAGIGGYIRAGSDFMLTKSLFLGFDATYVVGPDLDFEGIKAEVDGLAVAARLGWSF